MSALRTSPTAMEIIYTTVSMQESNGVITAYLITYYTNNRNTGCQNPVMTVAPANGTVAVIQGLDSTQEYCVTVAARTSVGAGESSQVVTIGCKNCFHTHASRRVNLLISFYCSVLLCYYSSLVARRAVLYLVTGELKTYEMHQ